MPDASALGQAGESALVQQPPLHEGNSLTLREAATRCNVSPDTIKRRRQDGAFPGAEKVDGAWRIPLTELNSVAQESGWKIGLDQAPLVIDSAPPHASATPSPRQDSNVRNAAHVAELEIRLVHASELHGAEIERERAERATEVGEKIAEIGQLKQGLDAKAADLDRVAAERDRHRSDVEHLRAELDRVKAEKADIEKTAAVAEALAAERAEMLAKVESAATDSGERADAAVAALGWLGRRRYRRSTTPDQP